MLLLSLIAASLASAGRITHPRSDPNEGTGIERSGFARSATGLPIFGLAYSPFQFDTECATPEQIQTDFMLMSKYTNHVRVYSLDCDHQISMVNAAAIYDMQVSFGLLVDEDPATYIAQLSQLQLLLIKIAESATPQKLTSTIHSVVVGNEAVSKHILTMAVLFTKFQQVRDVLGAHGMTNVKVTTAEVAKTYASWPLIDKVDFVLLNLPVFMAKTSVLSSTSLVWSQYDQTFQNVNGRKAITIGEVGWPSRGATRDGSADSPSVVNARYFLHAFVCEANQRGVEYFYHEAFNSPWKAAIAGADGAESYWGLFDVTETTKIIKPFVAEALVCNSRPEAPRVPPIGQKGGAGCSGWTWC